MGLELALCKDCVLPELRKRSPLFGDWKLQRFLGAGSFAYVFLLGHQKKRFPPVALKVIPLFPESAGNNGSLSKTLFSAVQEITRYVELGNHPNLVSMHNYEAIRDVGDSKGSLLLIMTDFYSNTLNKELACGPLAYGRVASILMDCVSGLEYMHKLDIVHRDIKPGNIFFDEDGRALIGDFGISMSLRQNFGIARYAGTLAYMPPEACNGPDNSIDPFQLDLYALAVSGYKMLEGVLPHQRESMNFKQMLDHRISGKRISFSSGHQAPLQALLSKALRRDPAGRFPTAASFRMALEAVVPEPQRNSAA